MSNDSDHGATLKVGGRGGGLTSYTKGGGVLKVSFS